MNCPKHLDFKVTNYCYSGECMKFLCPNCIDNHSQFHEQNYTYPKFQTIEKVLDNCKQKVEKQISKIKQFFGGDIQKQNKILVRLEKVKKQTVKLIIELFDELSNRIQEQIKVQNEKYNLKKKQIDLKSLKLLLQERNLQAIKKIYMLEPLKINNINRLDFKFNEQKLLELNLLIKQKLVTLKPTLDMYLTKIIPIKQYFQTNIKQQLHYLIPPNVLIIYNMFIRKKQKYQIELENKKIFDVPIYHKSIMISKQGQWVVFLIGGMYHSIKYKGQNKKMVKQLRNSEIFQIKKQNKSIRARSYSRMKQGRSSMCICLVKNKLFIVGGINQSGQIVNTFECYDIEQKICSELRKSLIKSYDSCICNMNNKHIYKFGGFAKNKQIKQIQRYKIIHNEWQKIPVDFQKEPFPYSFNLSSCFQINENQIFILGGYYEQISSEGINKVTRYNETNLLKEMKCCLPIAQAFWNPNCIIENKKLYVLQNIGLVNQCEYVMMDKRRLLEFDGQSWQIICTL